MNRISRWTIALLAIGFAVQSIVSRFAVVGLRGILAVIAVFLLFGALVLIVRANEWLLLAVTVVALAVAALVLGVVALELYVAIVLLLLVIFMIIIEYTRPITWARWVLDHLGFHL